MICFRKFTDASFVKSASEKLVLTKSESNIESHFSVFDTNPRMVSLPDISYDKKLNGGTIKQLTGADVVTYRPFQASDATIDVSSKIIGSMNKFPKFDANDDGLQTRLRLFPFSNKFKSDVKYSNNGSFWNDYSDAGFTWLCHRASEFLKTDSNAIGQSRRMLNLKAEETKDSSPLSDFSELFEEIEEIKDMSGEIIVEKSLLHPQSLYDIYKNQYKGDMNYKVFCQFAPLTFPKNKKSNWNLPKNGGNVKRVFFYKYV